MLQSPSYPAHSSTQLINQSHFHEWWKLQCLRDYRKLINPRGQQPRLEGRLLAAAFIPTLLLLPSAIIQPSLPCVSLIVINIDQLSASTEWEFIPWGLVVHNEVFEYAAPWNETAKTSYKNNTDISLAFKMIRWTCYQTVACLHFQWQKWSNIYLLFF